MMAQRIDHHAAKIPQPTPELFLEMAESGYVEMTDRCILDGRVTKPMKVIPWDEIDEATRERWEGVAKAMYVRMAVAGGATETAV